MSQAKHYTIFLEVSEGGGSPVTSVQRLTYTGSSVTDLASFLIQVADSLGKILRTLKE